MPFKSLTCRKVTQGPIVHRNAGLRRRVCSVRPSHVHVSHQNVVSHLSSINFLYQISRKTLKSLTLIHTIWWIQLNSKRSKFSPTVSVWWKWVQYQQLNSGTLLEGRKPAAHLAICTGAGSAAWYQSHTTAYLTISNTNHLSHLQTFYGPLDLRVGLLVSACPLIWRTTSQPDLLRAL